MGIIASEHQTNAIGDGAALNHFNWGAFWFDWIWGLANGCLGQMKMFIIISLCMMVVWLIPIVNIFVIPILALVLLGLKIYYGIKGNEWAYDGRAFYNMEDMEATQKRWGIAAGVVFALIVLYVVVVITFSSILVAALTGGFGGSAGAGRSVAGPSYAKDIVADIVKGEKTNGKFASGPAAVDYLLENSSFVKSQSALFKASKYRANSFKMYMEDNPDTIYYLFLVKKEANCSLSQKNCYVVRYHMHTKGETPRMAEKVYFDNSGKTKAASLSSK